MKIASGTIILYKDSFGEHYGIVEKDRGSKVHTFELVKDGNKWVKTFMNRDIPKSDIIKQSVGRATFGNIVGEAKERDYKKEYEQYHSKPEQRKNRSERNKARRKKNLEVGDPREVDHKKPLSKGGSNSDKNLRVVSRETNRKKGNKNENFDMKNLIKKIIKEELGKLNEFQEDLKKQMIILMGLPASGKSTFIGNELTKYFPSAKGFNVTNSDTQVRALQYKYASEHLNKLKGKINSEKDFLKFIQGTLYKTNRGGVKKLPITFDELGDIKTMSLKQYFEKYYKPYYATYFDIRDMAKSIEKGLFNTKIHKGGDVVVIDTTGTNIDKMVKRALVGKGEDYNISVLYLQIDPELTIIRDKHREEDEGRGVGESVIMGYASKIENVYQQYKKIGESGGPIDRLMKFKWNQKGDDPIEGNYSKVEDNRYTLKRKAKSLKGE